MYGEHIVIHRVALTSLLVASACSFPFPADVDDDVAIDASSSDATVDATTCEASSIVCDDASGVYTECSSEGAVTFTMRCPLGCDAAEEKCVDIDPSNGLAAYLDRARTDPAVPEVEIFGNGVLDTLSGELMDGSSPIDVPDESLGTTQVFMFKTLTINGSLKVPGVADGGRAAPILVVDGDVIIKGPVDVSGDLGISGPGARVISDPCSGGYVLGGSSPSAGGGSGGRVIDGARGGNAGNSEAGGTIGAAYIDDDLSPLRGGCRGGHVFEDAGGTYQSSGGGGGGAIQIVSSTRIILMSSGSIDASGGGGVSGTISTGTIGGGGGGSGGGILLEAPEVILDGPSVVLSTKGGGGAAAGNGAAAHHGTDGGLDDGRAPGGTNSGQASGGSGHIASSGTGSGPGGNGASSTSDGGGAGGASGQVRINTREGAAEIIHGATIRSRRTEGRIGTRLVPMQAE